MAFAQKAEVNTDKSNIEWLGKKIGGQHNGNIDIKSGYLELNNNAIVAGEFVIDMTTITNEDLKNETYNQKLVGHLKSDDFFGVANYPTAKFVVVKSSVDKNGKTIVTGDLTIKNKTEQISFETMVSGKTFTSKIEIDRSKFDVKYGSNSFFDNLGDKAIEDMFTLDITLVLN